MVPLLLINVKSVLASLNALSQVLHFVFSFLLVVGRIRSRVGLGVHVVERRGAVLWIAVFVADTIETKAAHLDLERAIATVVSASIYLRVPLFFHYELFAVTRTPTALFGILG